MKKECKITNNGEKNQKELMIRSENLIPISSKRSTIDFLNSLSPTFAYTYIHKSSIWIYIHIHVYMNLNTHVLIYHLYHPSNQ
jgi:hypothetical protein